MEGSGGWGHGLDSGAAARRQERCLFSNRKKADEDDVCKVERGGAQGRESRQRQELEKDKGRSRGWEGRMGLLAGASLWMSQRGDGGLEESSGENQRPTGEAWSRQRVIKAMSRLGPPGMGEPPGNWPSQLVVETQLCTGWWRQDGRDRLEGESQAS